MRVTTSAAAATAALVLTLAGCGSSGSSQPSPTAFDTLADSALVSKEDVTAIAGEGFEPYDSQTTASATEPAACLELLRFVDGTRTGPPATASSATVSYARGDSGASITNTVHVMADQGKATQVYDHVVDLQRTCATFTAVVGASVLKATVAPVSVDEVGERSVGVRVTITSPQQKSDVTTAVAQQGRTLVVAVAGTPDGADEQSWASKTAAVSAGKAAAIP